MDWGMQGKTLYIGIGAVQIHDFLNRCMYIYTSEYIGICIPVCASVYIDICICVYKDLV